MNSEDVSLKLLKFTKLESYFDFKIYHFIEDDIPFCILSSTNETISRFDYYGFGVIDSVNNYYWFFNGNKVAKDRNKAKEIYISLLDYCKENNLGTPFAFKQCVIKKGVVTHSFN